MNFAHPPSTVFTQIFPHPTSIAIEAQDYTVAELAKLKTIFPHTQIQETADIIETFRLTKDPTEIKLLTKAGRLTARLMSWAHQMIIRLSDQPVTEIEFSHLLEHQAHLLGADGLAFPPVVAFGAHTTSPHHQATKTKLQAGPFLLDLGVKYHGYCSDMTRTFWLGTPPPRFRLIKSIVRSAYQNALFLLQTHFHVRSLTSTTPEVKVVHTSGVNASDIDQTARSFITNAGFGKQFIHTTGHGLGLEIHEPPSLNSKNTSPLKPGMILTLEPGIYLPHRFGFRHENTLYLS